MKKTVTTLLLSSMTLLSKGQNALLIPDTLSGQNIALTLQNGTHQFFIGQNTTTMGANGNVLGPTLLLNHGDFVNFTVSNQLMDTTTIHWHGLHVSAENDGGPHTFILPNATWNPSFTIMDRAATYWYHPHLHHKTNHHVSKGIAGMIIVRDSIEGALNLPRTYGIDDIPVIIQTKDFDANNEIVVHSNSDDVLMVNATTNPFVDVPAQVIRLRVLNGSSQRSFNLGLTNNQTFYQIASDGGLLNNPYQTTRLLLAPGERAEILVDFSGMSGQSVQLKSYASELSNGIYGATNPGMSPVMSLNGYNPNPLNGANFDILNFNITSPTANAVTSIPTTLVNTNPWNANTANITRTLTFSPVSMGPNQLNGAFLINNSSFDMSVINYTIPLNNVEIWELVNQSAISHPFHIHDVQFNILTRNGVTPTANEQGWKDVVLVKPQETVRFIAKFEDFANDSVPYMYHCHLLTHEDDGMMGQFVVTNPFSTIKQISEQHEVTIFPNPSSGSVSISTNQPITKIVVSDLLGQEISCQVNLPTNSYTLDNLPKGICFISVTSQDKTVSKKVVIQ